MLLPRTEHVVERPDCCRVCGEPWPCAVAGPRRLGPYAKGRAVIELETGDMAVAGEQLVLDGATAAKTRAARSEVDRK